MGLALASKTNAATNLCWHRSADNHSTVLFFELLFHEPPGYASRPFFSFLAGLAPPARGPPPPRAASSLGAEYVRLQCNLIPPRIIERYNLKEKEANGYAYARTKKAWCGLKQSGKAARGGLAKHLGEHGYAKAGAVAYLSIGAGACRSP